MKNKEKQLIKAIAALKEIRANADAFEEYASKPDSIGIVVGARACRTVSRMERIARDALKEIGGL